MFISCWTLSCLMVIIMVSCVRSECLSKTCHAHTYFEKCPEDGSNGLVDSDQIAEIYSSCAISCKIDSECSAFNILQDGDKLSCELSTETTSCSSVTPQPGLRTYIKHSQSEDPVCKSSPRVALKTTRTYPDCPSGYTENPYSGTCIKTVYAWVSWSSSRAICQAEGGDLAKVLDADSNQFVCDFLNDHGVPWAWVGANRVDSYGNFHWLDETSQGIYKNWESYTAYYATDDCVYFYTHNCQWTVLDCGYEMSYVCEINLQSGQGQGESSVDIVQGSVANLRDAVLGGVELSVAIDFIDESNQAVLVYAIDSVEISGDSLSAHAYTFDDTLEMVHVRISTSGVVGFLSSGGSAIQESDVSLTWIVYDSVSICYLDETSAYLSVPALTINGNQLDTNGAEYAALAKVLSGSFVTIYSVRNFVDQSALSFPFDASVFADNSLTTTATWIPTGDYNLLNLDYDLSRSPVELTEHLDTTSWTISGILTSEQNLGETHLFIDPCWTLTVTYHSGGSFEGDQDALFTDLYNGADVGMRFSNATHSIFLKAEQFRIVAGQTDLVKIFSKMGITHDHGELWLGAMFHNYVFTLGGVPVQDTYSVSMYTKGLVRPYRYSIVNNVETEGSFDGAKTRIASGLIPRAMIHYYTNLQIYLDIEFAKISEGGSIILKSYRTPEFGYVICRLELPSKYFSATMSRPDAFGTDQYAVPTSDTVTTLTLFFEESA